MTTSGGHVPNRHLAPLDVTEADVVAVAERFLGVPYLWGGKTSLGLDCSGLVQVALTACGIPCPRDSDMQERALGAPLAPAADLDHLRRGDLLFWQGHVAIARDATTLVHANAFPHGSRNRANPLKRSDASSRRQRGDDARRLPLMNGTQ